MKPPTVWLQAFTAHPNGKPADSHYCLTDMKTSWVCK